MKKIIMSVFAAIMMMGGIAQAQHLVPMTSTEVNQYTDPYNMPKVYTSAHNEQLLVIFHPAVYLPNNPFINNEPLWERYLLGWDELLKSRKAFKYRAKVIPNTIYHLNFYPGQFMMNHLQSFSMGRYPEALEKLDKMAKFVMANGGHVLVTLAPSDGRIVSIAIYYSGPAGLDEKMTAQFGESKWLHHK